MFDLSIENDGFWENLTVYVGLWSILILGMIICVQCCGGYKAVNQYSETKEIQGFFDVRDDKEEETDESN